MPHGYELVDPRIKEKCFQISMGVYSNNHSESISLLKNDIEE